MSETFKPKYKPEIVPIPEKSESRKMQEELIELMKMRPENESDRDRIFKAKKDLKRRYMEKYPHELESIELMFDMKKFITISRKLSRNQIEPERIPSTIKNLTEYQFLITHHTLEASKSPDSRKILKDFWRISETIAYNAGMIEQFVGLKKGVLGQVASFKIMEKLGQSPSLSHPKLDGSYSVDLTAKGDTAIQVKTNSAKEPLFLDLRKVEEVGTPSVVIEQDGKETFISERHLNVFQEFKLKLEKLSKKTSKTYVAYEFVIPIKMVDEYTGEPSPEAVEYFKRELHLSQSAKSIDSIKKAA